MANHPKAFQRTAVCLIFCALVANFAAPAGPARSQNLAGPKRPVPVVSPAVAHDVSLPLRQMGGPGASRQASPAGLPAGSPLWPHPADTLLSPSAAPADPALQGPSYPNAMPALLANFEGVPNLNNVSPPDTQGDIGYDPATNKKYYVQWVNLSFQMWDVTDPAHPVSVYGPLAGRTLWSGLGGPCQNLDDGDPITLYDPLAHRWLMSQFALPNYPYGPFYECIAISTTGDPTGSYYRYAFQVHLTKMNDYPKFGVWPDAYYMSVNQFDPGWAGAGVFAFDRAAMLNGNQASFVYFDLAGVNLNYGGLLPADLDGAAPPAGAPGIFAEVDDNALTPGLGADAIRLWNFQVDWTTPSNSTFGLAGNPDVILPVASYDSLPCVLVASQSCIPQAGTTRRVDGVADRAMFRLAYRNFDGTQSLVFNHTVKAAEPDIAGVRWYQLVNTGPGWLIGQQGTFAPSDGLYRWMGSIAMDGQGNLGLGYSVSSSTTYPSIRVTGRLAADVPPGQMTLGETTVIDGAGYQSGSASRWGDYSMMAVDPQDECTFWYTQEYGAVSGSTNWHTRIAAFKFPTCAGPSIGTLDGNVRDGATPIAGASVEAGPYRTLTGPDGHYQMSLPAGSYPVTASKYGFTTQTQAGVAITNGNTTSQDFTLDPLAAGVVHGVVTDAGHGYPLYARLAVDTTGFSTTAYTDPFTGEYSLNGYQGIPYHFHLEAALLGGYLAGDQDLTLNGPDTVQNFALAVDPAACSAPGYFAGSPGDCQPVSGGMVAGHVRDANLGLGLVGASVSSDTGASALSLPAPDGAAGDGLYYLFQPAPSPASHTFTAQSTPLYGSLSAQLPVGVSVPANFLVHDFLLPAGLLTFTPDHLAQSLLAGKTGTAVLTLKNVGSAAADYAIYAVKSTGPLGPFERPLAVIKPFKQTFPNARGLPQPDPVLYAPRAGGTIIQSWLVPGGIFTWGISPLNGGPNVWLSSPAAAWGGLDLLREFTPAGLATGAQWNYPWPHTTGPADLTYNPHTRTLWVMNVSTDGYNCIYEINPAGGYTGNTVCPTGPTGFSAAQFGLAYDSWTDTYYAGSWTDNMIHQFAPDGTELRSKNVGLSVTGLAFNPDTGSLFVLSNEANVNNRIVVLDARHDFAKLGQLNLAGFSTSYSGAGLEMDCDGHLWAVDQYANKIFEIDSGETTTFCQPLNVPWLSESLTQGTLPAPAPLDDPARSVSVTVTFDTAGLAPGTYHAALRVYHRTPSSVITVPVDLTVVPRSVYLPLIRSVP